MTKSSRKKDRSMGYPKETAKYKKCEEHKNKSVKIGVINVFVACADWCKK